ncbi:hypothetical protein Tco_0053199 [Tanacetum coccineum]
MTVFVLSSSYLCGVGTTEGTLTMHILCGRTSFFKIETKSSRKGSRQCSYPRFTKLGLSTIGIKPTKDIAYSESYKEYYAMASGTCLLRQKVSKKKANTDAIPKRKSSTAPKKKKSGTGKQKTSELENISEAELTEAEQLKIDDISWKSSDDDQDDEQDQDDDDAEKHEVHETTQEQEED